MTITSATEDQTQFMAVPNVPGLTFRGFRGEADYPDMARIITAVNEVDQLEGITTIETVARTYDNIQRSDPDADMIFAEVDGLPIGYGRCMWAKASDDEDYYTYSFFVHLHPDWREKGIGKEMAAFLIGRVREMASNHPLEIKKYLQSWGSETQTWQEGLMRSLGLEPIRYGISMTRPCSQPVPTHPLPAGIEIRPVEEDQLRMVFNATVEAFQDHWNFVEPTEKDYQNWLSDPDFDPSLWMVAWEGDEVVGTVLNYINKEENERYNRKRGYTENICTRRPWRKKGLASALLAESIQMFIEMGMEETALGVDTENPSGALKLYQGMGYTETKRYITYRKEIV